MLWDRFSGCPTLTPPYHRVPPLESADLATATALATAPTGVVASPGFLRWAWRGDCPEPLLHSRPVAVFIACLPLTV